MKKEISFILAIILLVLGSCSSNKEVEFDYGESETYITTEMEPLANIVKKEFAEFEQQGYKLYKIRYAGDQWCDIELERYEKQYNKDYEACMVFRVTFSAPEGDLNLPSYKADEWWSYYFLKEPGGEWFLNDFGAG